VTLRVKETPLVTVVVLLKDCRETRSQGGRNRDTKGSSTRGSGSPPSLGMFKKDGRVQLEVDIDSAGVSCGLGSL